MKITIEVIEHSDQRYDTAGDWQFLGDELVIKVSSLGDDRYNFLVGIHEAIEAFLCREYGVSEALVDAFDKENIDNPDPGSIPGCPYYDQHKFATIVERMIGHELQVDWDDYETELESLEYGEEG